MEKKTNKETKGLLGNMVAKAKDFALTANDRALNSTEKAVNQSLEITAQWQGVAEMAIKGGLKLASNQQNLVFDILNEVKADLREGKKRLNKLAV